MWGNWERVEGEAREVGGEELVMVCAQGGRGRGIKARGGTDAGVGIMGVAWARREVMGSPSPSRGRDTVAHTRGGIETLRLKRARRRGGCWKVDRMESIVDGEREGGGGGGREEDEDEEDEEDEESGRDGRRDGVGSFDGELESPPGFEPRRVRDGRDRRRG